MTNWSTGKWEFFGTFIFSRSPLLFSRRLQQNCTHFLVEILFSVSYWNIDLQSTLLGIDHSFLWVTICDVSFQVSTTRYPSFHTLGHRNDVFTLHCILSAEDSRRLEWLGRLLRCSHFRNSDFDIDYVTYPRGRYCTWLCLVWPVNLVLSNTLFWQGIGVDAIRGSGVISNWLTRIEIWRRALWELECPKNIRVSRSLPKTRMQVIWCTG